MSRSRTNFFQPPPAASNNRGGGRSVNESKRGESDIWTTVKNYKTYIMIGGAVLAMALAYRIYLKSRGSGSDKSGMNVQSAVSKLRNLGASGVTSNDDLKSNPDAVRTLQAQVIQYQQHIGALENALAQRDSQLDQMSAYIQQNEQANTAQPPVHMGGGGGMGGGGDQFSGLHGQMPTMANPGPGPNGGVNGGQSGMLPYDLQGGMNTRSMTGIDNIGGGGDGGGIAPASNSGGGSFTSF